MNTDLINKIKLICQVVWPIVLPVVFEVVDTISGDWCINGKLKISTGKFIKWRRKTSCFSYGDISRLRL